MGILDGQPLLRVRQSLSVKTAASAFLPPLSGPTVPAGPLSRKRQKCVQLTTMINVILTASRIHLSVNVDRLQLSIQKRLQKSSGGVGVEAGFFLFSGDVFAGALALGELLLGLETAEALVHEKKRPADPIRERSAPCDGLPRRRADGAVHVQRQADEQLHHIFLVTKLQDLESRLLGRGNLQYFERCCEMAAFIAHGQTNPA